MQPAIYENLGYLSLDYRVYEQIKRKIVDNELRPGEKLDVSLLAADLGVSKTPVANALTGLALNGFVIICPRSASYVRTHTAEEMEYVFDFREAMEGLAVHKIIGNLDVARLEDIRARLEGLLQRSGPANRLLDEYIDTEMELHEYIQHLCPPIVSVKLENLEGLTKRLRKLHLRYLVEEKGEVGIADAEIRIHLELAGALLARNGERAEALVRKDIRATRDEVLNDFDAIEMFARSGR